VSHHQAIPIGKNPNQETQANANQEGKKDVLANKGKQHIAKFPSFVTRPIQYATAVYSAHLLFK
ncbi:MAG: hypothetical protein COC15_05000, partial [Legionellales bacterium]